MAHELNQLAPPGSFTLRTDLRRFFAPAAPDCRRDQAILALDVETLRPHLLRYIELGSGAQRQHGAALLARLEAL